MRIVAATMNRGELVELEVLHPSSIRSSSNNVIIQINKYHRSIIHLSNLIIHHQKPKYPYVCEQKREEKHAKDTIN
jgi:hypothetical protein